MGFLPTWRIRVISDISIWNWTPRNSFPFIKTSLTKSALLTASRHRFAAAIWRTDTGDFSAALRVLGDKPEKSDGVIGLYEIKRATSLLASGDFEEAGRSLEELKEAVRKTKGKKPALSANLRDNLEFLEQYRSVLTGGETNKAWLEEAFGRAQYNLRRLEIAHLLALIAVKNGDRKEAAQRLSYMKEQGGKTFFPRLADEIREKKLAQQKQK